MLFCSELSGKIRVLNIPCGTKGNVLAGAHEASGQERVRGGHVRGDQECHPSSLVAFIEKAALQKLLAAKQPQPE